MNNDMALSREIQLLEDALKKTREKQAKALTQCLHCDGMGWFFDTTYDRSGSKEICKHCYGTGLPETRIKTIINDTFAPFRKY